MERVRALVVLLGFVLVVVACGIKAPPRPPEPPPPPIPETQPPRDSPRGPLEPSIPPPDAGTS
jgi:hypothetical protein